MKKKILLLGDDIRVISGVSRVCKQLVLSGVEKYDWIQIAAQKTNPDDGNVVDVSESVNNLVNCKNSYVRLYCTSGYGSPSILRQVISQENPDAILHITDPRNWEWMYRMENEIRQTIPLCYYHVWDNDPVPMYNKTIYDSCDWIGCISKLTHECVKSTSSFENHSYVPHGVDTKVYSPLNESNSIRCRENILENSCKFMVFANNTNIRRKQLLLTFDAFDKFCGNLKASDAENVALLVHTNPENPYGSNLHTLVNELYPNRNIIFSNQVVSDETLNQMYNSADVTINLASNEGFGLSTLESLSAGTPIIVNKTGGLSEQIDSDNSWGIGISPKVRNLIGSPNVPYIYDDICCAEEVATAINELYEKNYDERKAMGLLGRDFILNNGYTLEDMCEGVYRGIETAIETHTPRESFKCIKVV